MQLTVTFEVEDAIAAQRLVQNLSIRQGKIGYTVLVAQLEGNNEEVFDESTPPQTFLVDKTAQNKGMEVRKKLALENLGKMSMSELQRVATTSGLKPEDIQVGKAQLLINLKQQVLDN